jgi:tRNA(Ile)-lysidine synthase
MEIPTGSYDYTSYNKFVDFLDQLRQSALHGCQLDPAISLVAGISGGPDSLCLLDSLHRLGFRVIVAHFDHALRPESGAEAALVSEMAAQRGLPFATAREDVTAFAREQHLSIEEAARTLRYRFLFGVARRVGAQAVAVGHNADDQVETVLMHLLRGSGLAGLKGMSSRSLQEGWDTSIPLVRPLLDFWRVQIEEYCRDQGLSPVQDASNQDTTYFRNRLRHELIPLLQDYNPQVKQVLRRTANVLAGDAEVLASASAQAWEDLLEEFLPGACALKADGLLALPVGLQRMVMRRAIAGLRPGLRDIDFDTIERALAFAARPSRSRSLDLVQGLTLLRDGNHLFVTEAGVVPGDAGRPQVPDGLVLSLEIPGQVIFGDGWVLRAERYEADADYSAAGVWEAWLDAEKIDATLEVCASSPGERFQPLGMNGRSQKLSDFWINVGLPRRARRGWPLVFSSGQVAWVPGYRLDHRFRVGETSKRLVRLSLIKNPA